MPPGKRAADSARDEVSQVWVRCAGTASAKLLGVVIFGRGVAVAPELWNADVISAGSYEKTPRSLRR